MDLYVIGVNHRSKLVEIYNKDTDVTDVYHKKDAIAYFKKRPFGIKGMCTDSLGRVRWKPYTMDEILGKNK